MDGKKVGEQLLAALKSSESDKNGYSAFGGGNVGMALLADAIEKYAAAIERRTDIIEPHLQETMRLHREWHDTIMAKAVFIHAESGVAE